jgi:hypothetical protein
MGEINLSSLPIPWTKDETFKGEIYHPYAPKDRSVIEPDRSFRAITRKISTREGLSGGELFACLDKVYLTTKKITHHNDKLSDGDISGWSS